MFTYHIISYIYIYILPFARIGPLSSRSGRSDRSHKAPQHKASPLEAPPCRRRHARTKPRRGRHRRRALNFEEFRCGLSGVSRRWRVGRVGVGQDEADLGLGHGRERNTRKELVRRVKNDFILSCS